MLKAQVFELRIVVRSSHLDEMEHVNNVQYLQWVQDVAKAHWEHNALNQWLTDHVWVALSHHIEYKRPAFLGDRLLVKTHVHSFEGAKSIRQVRIFNEETNALLVQSSSEWCLLKKASMKPCRIPQKMMLPFFGEAFNE
ncbi:MULTISPECIES: thioesterase family protein [Roseivirga]|uniref:acyl-CoA thioesterase n=1 Tax=Roseivirga TaxID=290180 RepID=UPI00257B5AFB|nr:MULTISPECIES: thioesterase family protein [Roseivirga]|tara:strand:- start:4683 stop:5099 length:417 start_codon:yes stop_codon:yes gene_type:complete